MIDVPWSSALVSDTFTPGKIDPQKSRGMNEKITDSARGMFEKATGKNVPEKVGLESDHHDICVNILTAAFQHSSATRLPIKGHCGLSGVDEGGNRMLTSDLLGERGGQDGHTISNVTLLLCIK